MVTRAWGWASVILIAALSLLTLSGAPTQAIAQGTQRLDTNGNQVNAHDGELLYWNSEYVWIGTNYGRSGSGCYFSLGSPTSQFCGFEAYTSSTGAGPWTDHGTLFDPSEWQGRCAAPNFGCFRPHEAYDAATGMWVLWANVSDAATEPNFYGTGIPDAGVQAWTATSPLGPFQPAGRPILHANWGNPQSYGDLDLFLDADGDGYAAYMTRCPTATCGSPARMAIGVERLDGTFTNGDGTIQTNGTAYVILPETTREVEAPTMFARNGEYYVLYSDPACPYCTGTGTSYDMASAPLGPYTNEGSISSNSCGGQPDAVSDTPAGDVYQSDQWLGTPNESAADQYWGLLSFNSDGTIKPIDCSTQWDG